MKLKTKLGRFSVLATTGGLLLPWLAAGSGNWIALRNQPAETIGTMLLLSDGTVMAQGSSVSSNWYRLGPTSTGGYTNGTWTQLASMRYTRLYFGSDVLQSGKVFVVGGEYGTGSTNAELYDPVANSWAEVGPPASLSHSFADCDSVVLSNGTVLIGKDGSYLYNPNANSWSQGAGSIGREAETSWVKLPDASILMVDPLDGYVGEPGTNSERYIPSLQQWVLDANVPVQLWANLIAFGDVGEIGPAILLPSGKAFFLGGSGHTAFYTPSGSSSPGSWTAGPDIPGGLVMADAPAAMMANGKILCAVGPPPQSNNPFPAPMSFCEYDPVANAFTVVASPPTSVTNNPPYITRMLDLPDGTVLFSCSSTQLWCYQPNGSPLPAGQPAVSSVQWNSDGTMQLTGTLFNGISEGAAYGDDAQMDSGYPLVRFIDTNNNVYYGRTSNWSSTGVMTGTSPVTTAVVVPAALFAAPGGKYSFQVVANGIASSLVSFQWPPAILTISGPPGSQAHLSWSALPGLTYQVQYTTNLDHPLWTNLGSAVTATSSNISELVSEDLHPQKYYRTELVP